MICSRHLSSGVDIVLLKILVSAITEQAVHIVCDYLTYTDIAPLSYFWSSFFVGNAGPLTNVGSRGPCPSPSFSGSTLPGWYPVNLLLCHSPNYFRMSALSESRWGPCSSYFDFLINTDRIFFPQEDIGNDPHVIWFEAETRGILVEEGSRLFRS